MSTRSVVAYPYGDGWQGVYCHSDGYPSWEGIRVIEQVQMFGGAGVRKLIQDTPEGFSVFPETPYTEGNMVYSAEDEQDNAALSIEWVYVVSERGVVTVLASRPTGETVRENGWDAPRYRWEIVGQVDCQAPDAKEQMIALDPHASTTEEIA